MITLSSLAILIHLIVDDSQSDNGLQVGADYQCKVADFGLSRHATNSGQPPSTHVAVRWASPGLLSRHHQHFSSN